MVDEPNAYTGLALEERTVLLKIHGHVDRGGDARARELRRQRGRPHRLPRRRGRRRHGAGAARRAAAAEPPALPRLRASTTGACASSCGASGGATGSRTARGPCSPRRPTLARELWRERGVEAYDVSLDGYVGGARAADAERSRRWTRPYERRPDPPTPFKGLARFGDSELDERFFFGRERETEVVAANLMASRLTVLYGPSGVGKSSLLRAGVARRLRALVPAAGGVGEATARCRS